MQYLSAARNSSFVGCFLTWPIGARFGRRIGVMVCSLVFCIDATIQTINSHQLGSFYAGRVIAGLEVGGSSVFVPLHSSEMSHKELHGKIGSG
jgi:MFS family permease